MWYEKGTIGGRGGGSSDTLQLQALPWARWRRLGSAAAPRGVVSMGEVEQVTPLVNQSPEPGLRAAKLPEMTGWPREPLNASWFQTVCHSAAL